MGITSEELTELKRLAERTQQGEWVLDSGVGGYFVKTPEKGTTIAIVHQAKSGGTEYIDGCFNAAFIAAANPATIIALIAEIERLRKLTGESE